MMVTGRFSEAKLEALFVPNKAPTWGETDAARKAMPKLSASIAEVLDDYPVTMGYARKQDAYPIILRIMEAAGWTLSGSGYFSIVFFKEGMALKIGLKPRDSGLMYAAWCRANQGQVGVPVLYEVQALHNMYAVLMDRCEAITDCDILAGGALYDPYIAQEFEAVRNIFAKAEDGWEKGLPIQRTATAIRDFFMGIARFDMHPGNVMLDREGRMVITDPVSFMGTDTDKYDEYYS